MLSEFYSEITINSEPVEVCVEYSAAKYIDDIDVEIVSVTQGDGQSVELSADQKKHLLEECYYRLDDDFEDDAASYGDYHYEMSREEY